MKTLAARSARCWKAVQVFVLLIGLSIFAGLGTASAQATETETSKPAAEDTESRKPVKVRQSTEAQLAKGEINFDDLKFDIEKDAAFDEAMWTKRLKRINGKKVRLRGYILPTTLFRNDGIKDFILVRDNQECCFGPGAALYDCVAVKMVQGDGIDFTVRPVTVEGKFILDAETFRYPGKGPRGATHFAVFRMEAIEVE